LEDLLKANSTPVPEQRIWDILMLDVHYLMLNANDFFCYACADVVELCPCDFKWALPIIKKYEFDGLNAVMSYIRRLVPVQERLNEKFWGALKEISQTNPMVYSDLHRYTSEELHNKEISPWYPNQEEIDKVMSERW
jgi:hypothetical protein